MNLKSAAVAFMVGALSLFGAGTSSATEHETRVADALKHAQAAVAEGQNDNAKGVAEHARQALTYAEMAEKLKSDPHITEAKTHLNQAIEHGDMGHANVAGEHAQQGVDHLGMAYKEEKTQ
jgi:Small metal-binding protein